MHSHTETTKKSTQAKRVSVSFESQQETAIMALLAHYGITFGVAAPRKSCANCQFIDIETIVIDNRSYDFREFIEHYIRANNKELSKDTPHFNKYQKRNMTAATNNVLTDMLKAIGWKISFKTSKEAIITLKMERINVLSFGGVVINGEDIALLGEKLNKGLKGVVSQKRDAPLMIGKNELPIAQDYDLSSITSTDLSPIVKMLQPINVSCQIGQNVMNDIHTEIEMKNEQGNHMNGNAYHYTNDHRRYDTEQYVIECSKILDGQNQSQNASQSIASQTMNCASSVNMNGQMMWNGMNTGMFTPCLCATPLAAASAPLQANGNEERGDVKRERDIIGRNITIDENMNKCNVFTNNVFTTVDNGDDELPPATNVPMNDMQQLQSHQMMGQMSQSTGSTITTESTMMYTMIDGQMCLLQYIPYYGWCYYPCTMTLTNEPSNVMTNAMVEGVEGCEEGEVDCYMSMANYYNAV